MTLDEIPRLRMARQQISAHDFTKPKDLVGWMGAMQAQDYNMVKWAVALRLPGTTEIAIQKALDKGEIIRTHVLRPTWHLVTVKDVSWMLDLTAPHIKSSLKFRHRELEITPAIVKKSLKVMEKALTGGQHLTREELLAALAKNKISTHDQRASHLLLWAELEKLICSGVMKQKKNTYALFDERVSSQKNFTRDEAMNKLAARYFQSHGPATLQDFTNWSSLSKGDARKALESVRKDMIDEKIDAQTYWFTDEAASFVKKMNSVYLLPAFDEYIIGYKDRSASIPAKYRSEVISANGIFWPVVVVNGMVTGMWKRTIAKKEVLVEFKFFPGAEVETSMLKRLLKKSSEQVKDFFSGGGSG